MGKEDTLRDCVSWLLEPFHGNRIHRLVQSTHHLGAEGRRSQESCSYFAAQYILMLVWPPISIRLCGMRGYCLSQLWKRSSAMLDCVGQKLRAGRD
jgi:hypothetical protein